MGRWLRKIGILAILLAATIVPALYFAMYAAISRGTIDEYARCISEERVKGDIGQDLYEHCRNKFARPMASSQWTITVSKRQYPDGLTYCDMEFINGADAQVVVRVDIKTVSSLLHESPKRIKQDVLLTPYSKDLLYHQVITEEQEMAYCSESLFEVRQVSSVSYTKTWRPTQQGN